MEFYVINGGQEKGNKVGAQSQLIDTVLLEQNSATDWKEELRERFIAENEEEWAEVGNDLRAARIERGISLAGASRMVGFSPSTLARFEKGTPVRNAHVIERSYEMLFRIDDLESELISAYEAIDDLTEENERECACDDPLNETYGEVDIPVEIIRLTALVMNCEHKVVDFDYKRIYIDTCTDEYIIRTWDFYQSGMVDWTLYKMVSNDDGTGHGEEIRSGSTNLKQFSN
ncbi:helix-turn-helix domain-containing protein [Paenibacillus lautus]|uniref:helix-turn-helix domain-containing protein n=1 Tax=Paenibacillus lautus TaxID=1401 RepID=UPI00384C821A